MGYAELTDRDHADDCLAIDDNDAPRLHRAATRLNRSIKRAVGKRKGFRFVNLVPTFRDHRACDHGTAQWINRVIEGEKNESFDPNWKAPSRSGASCSWSASAGLTR